jgi:hypothetical protein
VAAALAAAAGRAGSQDPQLEPTYGQVKLSAGFEPDPYMVTVLSGGAIQTDLGGVKAWVARAPDFRVRYTAGSSPLTFKMDSKGDTTLLINAPDGRWYANDDDPSGGTLNPRVTFGKPQSGVYDVWVGTVPKKNERGFLVVTELRP